MYAASPARPLPSRLPRRTSPSAPHHPLLQAHKASLQRKLAERQADVAAQQAELEAVERENEGLRARIAAQTVHPADVMRMNQEK